DLRPIFQYFPLQEARISDVMTALSAVVGQKVRATPLAAANAILLFGLPQDLQTVSKMVLQLDQAYFGNSLSVRIDPVYWSAQPLAQRLQ
ncbi:secretin N-terminal domain-containing protein, partial [Acinetobacter baumannii]